MISIIAAVSKNGVIGKNAELPWRLSSDLKRFSATTKGHTVIMGRKTYESIMMRLGKPLPNRRNVVITTQKDFVAPQCVVVQSFEEAMAATKNDGEIFVIGGELVYQRALTEADKLYLTEVDIVVDGDAYFPDWNKDAWEITHEEFVPADEKNEYPSRYMVYKRHT